MKKLLYLSCSLIIGFCLGAIIKFTYEATAFKPYSWKKPPTIINCYGKNFSEVSMIRAIHYWAVRDQQLGLYVHKPNSNLCKELWIDGYIIIRRNNALPRNTLASTKRYTSVGNIKSAVIDYNPGSFNLYLINEHELGHALGFSHINEIGHIMNPMYKNMGLDFYIK